MIIQPLTISYFDQAAKLMRYSWDLHAKESDLVSKEKFDKIDMIAWLEKLTAGNPYHCFVAIEKKKVVGLVSFEVEDLPRYYAEDKQLFVIDIIVAPDHQHLGIATKLEKFAEDWAVKNNINQIAGEIYGLTPLLESL